MRNFKKFLALVLATLMVVSAAATVSAFSDVESDDRYVAAIEDLVEKEIVNGVGDDKFNPTGLVERYQMALMMARALNPAENDWQAGMAIFTDVNEWYGAIAYAYMNNIVTGIGGNQFAPHDGIKYQDALIMAVRALGYTVDVTGDPYWLAAYQQAEKLGLTANVAVNKGEQTLTRAETAQVIYNMLYATPADGGATIAAKNFGEATAANTTTFVITATSKQAYAESYKAAEEGYVGVQTLVNGLPSGDVMYLPAIVLGIEEDEIEDYFSYAFDFVNYNAKTGAFDRVIKGLEPVVLYNADVTKNSSSSKLTIDGVAYYPVEQITGAALKNEIVLFNGGELASAGKMLLINKDGDIVNYNGTVLATFAYETANGTEYYVDQDVSAGTKVISRDKALEKYGVEIDDGTYTKYTTLTADNLEGIGNYQLTMFDDDRDGKYERAVATPVYLSVFKAKGGDGKEDVEGAMYDDEDVVYSEKLVKGDVFTYTYNEQLKVVNILDIIEPTFSTVTKINTTNINTDSGANRYAVKLTIDGNIFTLGNSAREKVGLTGANIYKKYTDVGAFDKIATDTQKIGYLFDNTASNYTWTDLRVGSPIKYYAVGDTIVYAQSYKIDDVFDRVVLKEIVSYDSDAVYVDLYLNGKLLKDVAVSKIDDQTISKLHFFQLSRLLADNELFATGNVFRAVKLSDGSYQLSENLDRKDDDSLDLFKMTTDKFGTLVTFIDGIADVYTGGTITGTIDGNRVIRTKSTTSFYFLKQNDSGAVTSISSYVGAPNKSSIDFSTATGNKIEIYADKIGYGSGAYNGVASTVLVYYTNADDIKGFGVANVEYTTAYVVDKADKVQTFDMASAEELGLTGSEYAGKYFYSYSADGLAVDLATGAKINTIYSEKTISKNSFYKLSSDNVVIGTATVKYADLNKDSFDQNRYYEIGSIVTTAEKVSTVKLTKSTAIDVKTDSPKDVLDKTYSVAYIENYDDGSFVGVAMVNVAPVTPPEGQVSFKTNAIYTTTSAIKPANFTANVADKVLNSSVIVMISDKTFTEFGDTVTGTKVNFGPANYSISSIKKGTKTLNAIDFVFDATVNSANNLAISLYKKPTIDSQSKALETGVYTVVISNDVVPTDTITISFTVS